MVWRSQLSKTTNPWVAKNLIIRADPPFQEIIVIHCDPEYTKEYDDIDVELLGEVPAPDEFEGEVKTLVVLDDLEFKSMNKVQKKTSTASLVLFQLIKI